MPRKWVNTVDNCCGEVAFANEKKSISSQVKKAYNLYFGCKVGWLNGKRPSMPLAVSMVWREPSNHINDCYFCLVSPLSGRITKQRKSRIVYPNIPSALRPVPHGEGLTISEPPTEYSFDSSDEDKGELTCSSPGPSVCSDPDFQPLTD